MMLGKSAVKVICAGIIVAVAVSLTACGASELQPAESVASTASSVKAKVQEKPFFESDTKVNWVITDYNEIAEYPFRRSQIEKGNVKTKAIIKAENLYIEVINSEAGMSISIEDKDEEEESLYPVFRDMLRVLDKSVLEEMIEQAWKDIQKDKYEINYGSTTLLPSYEVKEGIQISYSSNDIYGQRTSVKILDSTY